MLKEPDTILKDRRMTRAIIVNSCTKIKTDAPDRTVKPGSVSVRIFTAAERYFRPFPSITASLISTFAPDDFSEQEGQSPQVRAGWH